MFYTQLFHDNHAVYGILWENVVEWDRPQMKIQRILLCILDK